MRGVFLRTHSNTPLQHAVIPAQAGIQFLYSFILSRTTVDVRRITVFPLYYHIHFYYNIENAGGCSGHEIHYKYTKIDELRIS